MNQKSNVKKNKKIFFKNRTNQRINQLKIKRLQVKMIEKQIQDLNLEDLRVQITSSKNKNRKK